MRAPSACRFGRKLIFTRIVRRRSNDDVVGTGPVHRDNTLRGTDVQRDIAQRFLVRLQQTVDRVGQLRLLRADIGGLVLRRDRQPCGRDAPILAHFARVVSLAGDGHGVGTRILF